MSSYVITRCPCMCSMHLRTVDRRNPPVHLTMNWLTWERWVIDPARRGGRDTDGHLMVIKAGGSMLVHMVEDEEGQGEDVSCMGGAGRCRALGEVSHVIVQGSGLIH